MPKLLTIQIPHPCSEDPAGMLPTATGSYCRSCKKEVIDFTGMSDSKLAAFFKNNPGDVCGRFYPDQLNTPIPLPKRPLPWVKYFFTIVIPTFLISLRSGAQNKLNISPSVISAVAKTLQPVSYSDTVKRILEGIVTDENGNPIEAASVMLLNSRSGTTTDPTGRFKIRVPVVNGVLRVSSVEIVTTDINIPPSGPVNITVTKSPYTSLGAVVVVTVAGGVRRNTREYEKAPKAPRVKTETNNISVFPNPARSGDELNISWKNKIETDQILEIFSADGSLVQKEIIRVTGKISACSFLLNNLHPGFYIFMAIDTKTGIKTSREFIVE